MSSHQIVIFLVSEFYYNSFPILMQYKFHQGFIFLSYFRVLFHTSKAQMRLLRPYHSTYIRPGAHQKSLFFLFQQDFCTSRKVPRFSHHLPDNRAHLQVSIQNCIHG